ncbi:MAG: DnaJ domain-containing protein [Bacteriovoracia bacterium]
MKIRAIILAFLLLAFGQEAVARVSSEAEARALLGIGNMADEQAVKTAYRQAAKRFHPDANTSEASADKFNQIQEAYDFLRTKNKSAPNPGFRQYGFGEDFSGAGREKAPSEVSKDDPFVKRFGLAIEAEGGLGEKPSLTRALKTKLEAHVQKLEQLLRANKTAAILDLHFTLEAVASDAEKKISRDIFFTMVGEHARRSSREADALLKGAMDRFGLESLPDLFTLKRELRLTGGDYGKWPELYPETTKAILGNPDLGKLDYETHRRLLLTLMSDKDLAKHPRFYDEIALKNPYLRGELEKKRIKLLFLRDGAALPEREFQAQSKILLANFEKFGPELDGARLRLLGELLSTNRNLETFLPLVGEIKKIKNFSSLDLVQALNGQILKGDAKQAALRRAMLGDFLSSLALHAPEVATRERANFAAALNRWGTKGWEEVLEFLEAHLDRPGTDMPVSAEYRLMAQKCSDLYAKTAKNIR